MTGDARQALLRAAQTRASIRHAHLIPARAERDRRGRVRILLQRESAPTLAEVMSSGSLDSRDSLRLLYGVATAVEALHRRGLVARDLQPDRIHVCPRRGALLADPGIPLELLPRPAHDEDPRHPYRSPEELAGQPIDSRSNVYSLAAVFRATQAAGNGGAVPLPSAVGAVLDRAMAGEPARRSFNPGEFIIAVASACGLAVKRRQGGKVADPAPEPERAPAPSPAPAPPRSADAPKAPRAPADPPDPAPAPPEPRPAPTPPTRSEDPPSKPPSGAKPPIQRGRRREESPRHRLPRPTLPKLHAPALPRLSAPSLPRLSAPRLPRLHLPTLPRVRLPSPPSLRALARVSLVAVPLGLSLVGFLLAGVLLARNSDDHAEASQIERASFTIRLPADWGETHLVPTSGVELSAPLAVAPYGETGAGLVAGEVADLVSVDRRLRAEGARTETRLGRLQAWRYSGLRPRENLAATAYLAPTTGAPLLVVCHARVRAAGARLRRCEGIASTIALRDEQPIPLARVARYEQQVASVIGSLRRERVQARRRMADAKLASGQARAARSLEREYRVAVRRLRSIDAPSGTPISDDLLGSLRAAAAAYGRLARAAAHANKAQYRAAREAVVHGEEAVQREAAT